MARSRFPRRCHARTSFIRSGYAEPRGLAALASRIAPDAEFDFTAVYPNQPVLRGLEAMRRFRDEGPWGGSVHFEPERFFDVDEERVLVFMHVDRDEALRAVGLAS